MSYTLKKHTTKFQCIKAIGLSLVADIDDFTERDLDIMQFCVVVCLSRRAVADGGGSSGGGKKSRTFACNDYTTKTKN